MEKLDLTESKVMFDITSYLNDAKSERNHKRKTYHYCAHLYDYQSAHNIQRDFLQVTDIQEDQNKCTDFKLQISTDFLKKSKLNEVYEILVNIRESGKYSCVSRTYFVVREKNEDILSVDFYLTAFQAFNNL